MDNKINQETGSEMNRLGNCHNRFQGEYKKVLCVCSAGLLRSPTAAVVLSGEPFNFNTRAVGIADEYALVRIDDVLLEWADEIVCMELSQAKELSERCDTKIVCLEIRDNYSYREEELMELIKEKYTAAGK